MARDTIRVRGLAELSRAFAHAGEDTRKEIKSALADAAEPIRADAAVLALSAIRNMDRSPRWAGMKTGVRRKVVWVAPKVRSRRGSPRPNLARLLLDRAMLPALERNKAETYRRVERMLDTIGRKWEQD